MRGKNGNWVEIYENPKINGMRIFKYTVAYFTGTKLQREQESDLVDHKKVMEWINER